MDIEAFKFAISQPGALTAALNYYRNIVTLYLDDDWLRDGQTRITSPTLIVWVRCYKIFFIAVSWYSIRNIVTLYQIYRDGEHSSTVVPIKHWFKHSFLWIKHTFKRHNYAYFYNPCLLAKKIVLAMINFSLKTTTSTPFKLTGMWPHITFHHYILPGIDKMRERRASLAGTFWIFAGTF
jgi:hypothetical protein